MGIKVLKDRQIATNSATQDKEVKINKGAPFESNATSNMPPTVVNDKDEVVKDQEKLKENIVDNNKKELEKKEESDINNDDPDPIGTLGTDIPIYSSTSGKTTNELLNAELLSNNEFFDLEEVSENNYGTYVTNNDENFVLDGEETKYDTTSYTQKDTPDSNSNSNTNNSPTSIYNTGLSGYEKISSNEFKSKRSNTIFKFYDRTERNALLVYIKNSLIPARIGGTGKAEIQHHCTAGKRISYNSNLQSSDAGKYTAALKVMLSIETSHMSPKPTGRGFKWIAQHFSTFPDGIIAVGIPFDKRPYSISGRNTNGICIENYGGGDFGDEYFDEPQNEAIIWLTAALCVKFGLDPMQQNLIQDQYGSASVVYHAWFYQTGHPSQGKFCRDGSGFNNGKTCPGLHFFPDSGSKTASNTPEHCKRNLLTKVQALIKSVGG